MMLCRVLVTASALALVGATASGAGAAAGTADQPVIKRVTDVTVGSSPIGVASAGGKVFVAVQGGNAVAVIDPRTNKVLKQLKNLPEPSDIVASVDGQAVFVSTGADKGVTRIAADDYSRTSYPISGGGQLAASPDGRSLLVSPGGGAASRIALRSGKVQALPGTESWTIESFSPDGRYAYAERVDFNQETSIPEPKLLKVATRTWKISVSTDLTEDTDWSFAGDILADPAGRWVYVSKQGDNNGFSGYSGRTVQRYSATDLSPGRVYTIDRSTTETNVELGPQGLAFPESQWAGRLAVANSNTGKVSVIDTRTGAVTSRTSDVGVSAVGYFRNQLYAANTGFGGDFPTTTTVFRVPPAAGSRG